MLMGIAKAALGAPLLDGKRAVRYRELPTKKWLNRCQGDRVPFEWSINPYRGCEFGCLYCYARYSHEFMELLDPQQFEAEIFVKHFEPNSFRKELRAVRRGERIGIGTATDPYQPAERKYGVTRRLLEVLSRERGQCLLLTTKGDAAGRDADVMAEVGRRNTLSVNFTVTTADAELARWLEPKAPRPELRLGALRAVSAAGVPCGVYAAPVMPGINDRRSQLEEVARAAKEAGAEWFGAGPVFLKPCALTVFLPALKEKFPGLHEAYRERFENSAFVRKAWAENLQAKVREVREKYGLLKTAPVYRAALEPQMALFT